MKVCEGSNPEVYLIFRVAKLSEKPAGVRAIMFGWISIIDTPYWLIHADY
jgi:hypothetical protein